jgi:hypothetical protein
MVHQIKCLADSIGDLLVKGSRIRLDLVCLTLSINSCFNAFSRVDVRVEVKIPGGVESYYVDVRGDR